MVNFVNKNVFFYWTMCVIRLHWNQLYIELNMGKFPWILILPLLMVDGEGPVGQWICRSINLK